MKMPTVALVGSPNVGKSTIFNRLVGRKVAIIEDVPGITRDRIYGIGSYDDYKFNLIDTGGIDTSNETFNIDIKMQAEIAIDEADVVIFVVDGKMGLNANDFVVRDILFKSKKKVIVAINKIDNRKHLDNLYDFYELGFEHYIPISGEHAIGFDDLMDEVTKGFPKYEEEYSSDVLKFCLIGRPNVGKSSILNKLIEEDKAIVTSVAGTTRDIVEGQIRVNGILLNIIDTAGVRETEDIVEKIGVEKSLSLVNDADLIILVFNNNEKLTDEDKKLLEYTKEKKRIIVINKIDLENNLDISNLKNERIVKVSALKDSGIENLKNEINDMFNLEEINLGDFTYLSNSRQISLVKKAVEISKNLEEALNNDVPIDLLEIDIKEICEILGEIIGESYDDKLIDTLFSNFCLGK